MGTDATVAGCGGEVGEGAVRELVRSRDGEIAVGSGVVGEGGVGRGARECLGGRIGRGDGVASGRSQVVRVVGIVEVFGIACMRAIQP